MIPATLRKLQKGAVFIPNQSCSYPKKLPFLPWALKTQVALLLQNAVSGSHPKTPIDILAKAFQSDKNVVNYLLSVFYKIRREKWRDNKDNYSLAICLLCVKLVVYVCVWTWAFLGVRLS